MPQDYQLSHQQHQRVQERRNRRHGHVLSENDLNPCLTSSRVIPSIRIGNHYLKRSLHTNRCLTLSIPTSTHCASHVCLRNYFGRNSKHTSGLSCHMSSRILLDSLALPSMSRTLTLALRSLHTRSYKRSHLPTTLAPVSFC